MFNLPPVVLWTVGALAAVHAARAALGPEADFDLLLRFAFVPARYRPGFATADDPTLYWTPITYGLLHAGLEHLILNSLWLVVFGSAVAWRFGAGRFVLFALACTAAGAAAHAASNWLEPVPMIGASAGVSGLTAAAARFIFEAGGPLGAFRSQGGRYAFLQPATPFVESLRNPRVFAFVAIWFALTIAFGAISIPGAPGEGGQIAWEAHLGGFLAGLVLFPLFDPVPRRRWR